MLRRMSRPTWAFFLAVVVAAGCSPTTSGVNPTPPDLAPGARDLSRDCSNLTGNRLQNPSFESGDGSANNMATPPSTIAQWTGYGAGGTTTYTVTQTSPRCGTRAVKVDSANAAANVLLQRITSPADAGKQFQLAGWVFVTTTDATSQLKLDIWDLTANQVATSTVALTSTTNDWVQLSKTASVPTGGDFQVRINSTGNLQAFVDDLLLVIP